MPVFCRDDLVPASAIQSPAAAIGDKGGSENAHSLLAGKPGLVLSEVEKLFALSYCNKIKLSGRGIFRVVNFRAVFASVDTSCWAC